MSEIFHNNKRTTLAWYWTISQRNLIKLFGVGEGIWVGHQLIKMNDSGFKSEDDIVVNKMRGSRGKNIPDRANTRGEGLGQKGAQHL